MEERAVVIEEIINNFKRMLTFFTSLKTEQFLIRDMIYKTK